MNAHTESVFDRGDVAERRARETYQREDFERWLELQNANGYILKTPEAVEKIRRAFRMGAKVAPMQKVKTKEAT